MVVYHSFPIQGTLNRELLLVKLAREEATSFCIGRWLAADDAFTIPATAMSTTPFSRSVVSFPCHGPRLAQSLTGQATQHGMMHPPSCCVASLCPLYLVASHQTMLTHQPPKVPFVELLRSLVARMASLPGEPFSHCLRLRDKLQRSALFPSGPFVSKKLGFPVSSILLSFRVLRAKKKHTHIYGFVFFWCVELLQKAEGGTSPNHTPESYPRIIPRIIPPNHTP